jgi:putative addiction module killer protein
MRQVRPVRVIEYVDERGENVFRIWLGSLAKSVIGRVQFRLDRVASGNFGDHRFLGKGVSELRLHFGPGYRIYFGKIGNDLVILLGGGDKSSQSRDITEASRRLASLQERKSRGTNNC